MTIAAIITLLLGGLGAWLYSHISGLKQTIEELQLGKFQEKRQEWSDKIEDQDKRVQESLRDYEKFKKAFEENNRTPGDSSGSDNPPSGAV